LKHFGPQLKVRTFNDAYKAVFAKSRGRSRRAPAHANAPEPSNGGDSNNDYATTAGLGTRPAQRTVPGPVRLIAPPSSVYYGTSDGQWHLIGPDRVIEVPEAESWPIAFV